MTRLLSPANSFTTAKLCFNCGADAVYLSVAGWGLRPGIFDLEVSDLGKTLDYAHEIGKRVHLCMNIYPRAEELPSFFQELDRFLDMGVDALIISDPGLIRVVHQRWPQAEIHASVQAGVANYLAANCLAELGASTVIFSRGVEDIAQLEQTCRQVDVGLEVFVHGDVCYFFDSKCYLTGYLKREKIKENLRRPETELIGCSNRGECYLICKHKCQLVSKAGIIKECNLFRKRDMCRLDMLPELVKMGISYLKIEGRQFSPQYMEKSTGIYRKALDLCLQNPDKYTSHPGWKESLEILLQERDISYNFQRKAWLGR